MENQTQRENIEGAMVLSLQDIASLKQYLPIAPGSAQEYDKAVRELIKCNHKADQTEFSEKDKALIAVLFLCMTIMFFGVGNIALMMASLSEMYSPVMGDALLPASLLTSAGVGMNFYNNSVSEDEALNEKTLLFSDKIIAILHNSPLESSVSQDILTICKRLKDNYAKI